ncbi:MAG TPA: D-glycerate dehydrogenase [Chloroflexota bacterium]|nr:D-glycerate dehydrogenase [Chloroflexota bacterium]
MMAAHRVFLSRELPPAAMAALRAGCDLTVNPDDRVLSKQELIAATTGMDGLLCLLTDTIDAEVLDIQPRLRVVSNYAVGFNNIDVAAATARGIPVCNTPGVLTETTADFAWALLMAIARRVVEGDRFTREGHFVGWAPQLLLGTDIHGKTLGLVGAGRIGQAMAHRARGFAMRVLYHDVQDPPAAVVRDLQMERVEMDDLLRQSDYVSIHAPYIPETHHLIGAPQLALMRPTAYLINSARGPLIDEAALVRALRTGQIAGAGLDVYEHEPDLAPGLAELSNVVLAPHIASASLETRSRMGLVAVENLLSVLNGGRAPYTVNPEVYDRPG